MHAHTADVCAIYNGDVLHCTFARCIDLKCCKFLVASSWVGEVFPYTLSTSPSRPTFGLEVYEFYLNLLPFSVFLPSFSLNHLPLNYSYIATIKNEVNSSVITTADVRFKFELQPYAPCIQLRLKWQVKITV